MKLIAHSYRALREDGQLSQSSLAQPSPIVPLIRPQLSWNFPISQLVGNELTIPEQMTPASSL